MITPGNLILTTLIAVLLVGSKKVRHLGSDLGAAIKNFREAMNTDSKGTEEKEKSDPTKPDA